MVRDNGQMQEALFREILKLQTLEECKLFFDDLCTIKELDAMCQRVVAARMLLDGKTYNEIIEQTDISSATLSRVSKCVQYGEGYRSILNKQ